MKRHVYLSYRIIFLVATGVNITPENTRIFSAKINCCCAAARFGFRIFCVLSLADKRCSSTPGWSGRIDCDEQQNATKCGQNRVGADQSSENREVPVGVRKRVEGGVGQSREPKLSVCCLRTSAHPFLAKNRPGAPVFGYLIIAHY